MICSVGDCDRLVSQKSARGLCSTHYKRWLKHGDATKVGRSGRVSVVAPCKAAGCGRMASYSGAGLCQKHYFRQWRYGTTETTKVGKAKPRIVTPNGYIKLYSPGHPLAERNRYVYEHRALVYAMYGDALPPCELCGMVLTWTNAYVDHVDENPSNNNPHNLRPVCCGCNVLRGRKKPEHTYPRAVPITINGITKTAMEWAREPGAAVNGAQIRRRFCAGATAYDAVYGPKKTHGSTTPKIKQRKAWSDPRASAA